MKKQVTFNEVLEQLGCDSSDSFYELMAEHWSDGLDAILTYNPKNGKVNIGSIYSNDRFNLDCGETLLLRLNMPDKEKFNQEWYSIIYDAEMALERAQENQWTYASHGENSWGALLLGGKMNLKEFVKTLENNGLLWEEISNNIINLNCKQEYSFSNEGVYANGYYLEIKIIKLPIIGLRTFMLHRHKNAIINYKTEDYNKQIIVPEDIVILADIEIYQVKNIRIHREFGNAKI